MLRSPFIDKKSREQFEIRTHKRLIYISEPTPQTVDSLSSLNLPAGVDIRIKARSLAERPRPSALPDHPGGSPLGPRSHLGPLHNTNPNRGGQASLSPSGSTWSNRYPTRTQGS